MRWVAGSMGLGVAALMMALAPGAAHAQSLTTGVGLFTAEDGGDQTLALAPYQPTWIYLLIDVPVTDFPATYCRGAKAGPIPFPYSYRLRLRCGFDLPANLWAINFDPSLGGICPPRLTNNIRDPELDHTYLYEICRWPAVVSCLLARCLMRIAVMPLDDEPAPIYIHAGSDGGLDGLPTLECYFAHCFTYAECRFKLALEPRPGGIDEPIFVVNGGLVPVAGATWGALKTLYR